MKIRLEVNTPIGQARIPILRRIINLDTIKTTASLVIADQATWKRYNEKLPSLTAIKPA
jgi:hypothetical protein